jgi:hypothetical protein
VNYSATRFTSLVVNKREQLHNTVRDRVNRALAKVKSEPIKSEDLDLSELDSNPTVRQMLNAIKDGKDSFRFNAPHRAFGPKGATRPEGLRLDSLICRMLSTRFTPVNKIGRPRRMNNIAASLFEKPRGEEINILTVRSLRQNRKRKSNQSLCSCSVARVAAPCALQPHDHNCTFKTCTICNA